MKESRNLKTFVSKFIQEREVENFPHLYIVGEFIETQTSRQDPIDVFRKLLMRQNLNLLSKYHKDSTNRIW